VSRYKMWNNKPQDPQLDFKIEDALYSWTSFPFVDFPIKSVILCVIVALVAYLLWELAIVKWEQPLYYVLGIFMLLIPIMPYLTPTTYYLFDMGFLVQYPLVQVRKKYSEYGCFYADKLGVMLSTYKTPRRMDTFRGQSLRFSKTASERGEVLALLKEKIGKQYY